MEFNIILAGVGGQGILTTARGVATAALRRGWNLKQAEVHGMAQRGGAVQSHLRLKDGPLFSDLIPLGQADLILAVEPLESLRYVQYLRPEGVIVANTTPFVNISNYPPVELVLERIARYPGHILMNFERLARAAGSARSVNSVALGAASLLLPFEPGELEDALGELFAAKGAEVVAANRKAFQLGRHASAAYREGLARGGTSRGVRTWLDTVAPAALGGESGAPAIFEPAETADDLSEAEAHAFARALENVQAQDRRQLFEHEVYTLVELVGAISPPRYVFVPARESLAPELLAALRSPRVALKIVSAEIVHKSDVSGVVFVNNQFELVDQEIKRLVLRHSGTANVAGVLVVEFVEGAGHGLGSELFVGIRATREFGPVIAAGIGGIDTEYLAARLQPGVAVAKAVATRTSAEEFLAQFQRTAAYDLLSGRARGHKRIVSDGELLRCFRAFIAIARRFCVAGPEGQPQLVELEVNPFAFVQQRMVPLDGRGRLGHPVAVPAPRPICQLNSLLTPRTIGVLGVSAAEQNFGRIIVNNIRDCGFGRERLYIIKAGLEQIDGIRCVASLAELPEPLDLLVVAAGSAQLPQLIHEIVQSGKVQAVILIPGGVGETHDTGELRARVRAAIAAGRERPGGGPVFLGPNCLGVQSRPGKFDTFFIPRHKSDPRWSAPAKRVALISQSGAFIITRLSNLELLDPAIAISIGNQIDLTIADTLAVVGERDDIDVVGVYAEGFNDLDGVALLEAIERLHAAGKQVVFYKAGRTAPGRSAAAGHTASVAGDYDVCLAGVAHAGGIVVETFKEFEQLLELSTALHRKQVRGRRIGIVSNAGYETVGMADAIRGPRYQVEAPPLEPETVDKLRAALAASRLDALVNPTNPLDVTPMADEAAYEACLRVLLEADEIDAVAVGCVPLTPKLLTTESEIQRPNSFARLLPRLLAEYDKPLIAVIDCGGDYDPLARALRSGGVPVFRSSDQALRSLGRYLCQRAPAGSVGPTAVTREAIPLTVAAPPLETPLPANLPA